MANEQYQMEGPLTDFVTGVVTEDEQKAKRAELDQRLAQLQEQMFKFADLYGIEDFRTQLMIQLHDVAILMRDSVDLIQGVTVAMSYMFETIQFLDDMMKYQQDMMTGSLVKRYGLIARIKERIRTRRTVRNIKNRMDMFANRIAAIQGIAQVIVTSLTKATAKMQKKTAKNNEKFKKRNPSVDMGESKSMQMVRDHLSTKEIGSGVSPSDSSSGGVAPSAAGSSGKSGDDMSDIL